MNNHDKEQLKELLMNIKPLVQDEELCIQIIDGMIRVYSYIGEKVTMHLYYSPRFHGWSDDEDEEE